MEYSTLGTSSLKVSRIGLGTWAMGGWMWGGTDEAQAVRAIHRALDLGINLIDTAPVYGFGLSEEIVGRAVAQYGNRDKVIIATKLGLEWDEQKKKTWRNSSPERIRKEIDDSLRRLRTDYIDLYQVHWPDPDTPIEATAEILLRLYEEGKIRAIGVSNYSPEQMDAWRKVAPLHSNQPQLNLFQQFWTDTFNYCHKNQIGTLVWGPLAHGLLTGKFTAESTFPEDDLRHYNPMFKGERFKQYLAAVDKLKELAAEKGKSVMQLAIRWVLQQPGITAALWGARRPDQLEEAPGVMGWELSDEDLRRINDILRETVTDPLPKPEKFGPPPRSSIK